MAALINLPKFDLFVGSSYRQICLGAINIWNIKNKFFSLNNL